VKGLDLIELGLSNQVKQSIQSDLIVDQSAALALDINKSLVLIHEAGKLPLPTFSVVKPCSNVSPLASKVAQNKSIEME
jgi:hypothetical protein